MAHHLTFLLATYEALSDKSSLYAQSLNALVSERAAHLRAMIRRMMFDVARVECWVAGRLNMELHDLGLTPLHQLEVMHEQFCRRRDVVKQDVGSNG